MSIRISKNVKFFCLIMMWLMAFGIFVSASTRVYATEIVSDVKEKPDTLFVGKEESLRKLANYYYLDEQGKIALDLTNPTLVNDLKFSNEELSVIKDALQEPEKSNRTKRGFVGVVVHLGPKVRGMGAIVGGAFAGGVVAFYMKEFALTGPIQAGVVSAITASVAGVVAWAINERLTKVNVGTNIPFFSYLTDVYVP